MRCRADSRWVTTAETAECAIALACVGRPAAAAALLARVAPHRRGDGAFVTGLVHPERREFPSGEVTSYSTAAYVLAEDLLSGGAAGAAVFFGDLGD